MASEAKITEHTLIPLSLIIAMGTSMIGGVVWLSALWYREEANARAIVKLEKKQAVLYRVCRDLQEIKGALKLPRGDACDPNAYEN